MVKILHITPHLNGGLGRVVLSTLKHSDKQNTNFYHEVAVTTELNLDVSKLFSKYSQNIEDSVSMECLKQKIEKADIVQIEWWNHPLIYKMLFLFKFPPCRLIILSHISGFSRPQIINENIVDFSDLFLAATKATKDNVVFNSPNNIERNAKLNFVTYPVDLDRFNDFSFKAHMGFNVGYIGTLDYSKLHKNFLKMSSAVSIKNINFIVCGVDAGKAIQNQSKNFCPEIFKFLGFKKNIKSIFENLDVFGYPLGKDHFGSGEQAIIEAMSVGLPVVAFSNPAEKAIIRNNETGILVDTEQEYTEAIEYLYKNPDKRIKIGQNAKKDIATRLNPDRCFSDIENQYEALMKVPKKYRKISPIFKKTNFEGNNYINFGAKLFVESLGSKSNQFAYNLFNRSNTNTIKLDNKISKAESALKVQAKGSLYQYLYFFPDDPYLNFWAGIINKADCNFILSLEYFNKSKASSIHIQGIEKYINEITKKIN